MFAVFLLPGATLELLELTGSLTSSPSRYGPFLLGAALLLGVRTKHTLAVTSLTLVCLAYGLMLLGNIDGVTNVGVHLLLTAAALYFVRHNKCELLR